MFSNLNVPPQARHHILLNTHLSDFDICLAICAKIALLDGEENHDRFMQALLDQSKKGSVNNCYLKTFLILTEALFIKGAIARSLLYKLEHNEFVDFYNNYHAEFEFLDKQTKIFRREVGEYIVWMSAEEVQTSSSRMTLREFFLTSLKAAKERKIKEEAYAIKKQNTTPDTISSFFQPAQTQADQSSESLIPFLANSEKPPMVKTP